MSKYRQEPFLSFYKILGFYPKHIEYYRQAVRHRSVARYTRQSGAIHNERLEFLGDAMLNTIVSDILYTRYPYEQEGFLTNMRAKIVNRNSLNHLAVDIGLNNLVLSAKHVKRGTQNIYGNAMEALIGAIYLDYGYKKCKQFVEDRLFGYFIDLDKIAEDEINFKSRLIEWSQKHHLTVEFVLIEDIPGKHNIHKFISALELDGKRICEGSGTSKKQSEQEAAHIALQIIEDGVLQVEEREELVGEILSKF
ncbi:MAG: ribonuclease III [Prevotellaceae bacterium]|nr:ribonuclease III [Prevotellaceae bacterium]